MGYCCSKFKLATFLLTAVFLAEGRDLESLEQEIAALRPGLIVCSSGGSSMGPAQRLRAEAESDVQVCCLREDLLERVDEVVVPSSNGTSATLTRAALFDNMAAQPDGRYACVAMLRNRTAAAAAQSNGSSAGVTIVGTVLPACADGWRCNSCCCQRQVHFGLSLSLWNARHRRHLEVQRLVRFSLKSTVNFVSIQRLPRLELEVLDEFGSRYEDGDRVLVVSRDTLILRYRYGVSGEEPWRRPVTFSSKSTIRRHEGTLVLWEVARPLAVFVQVALHSRPPRAKSVMLNLAVVPRLTVGMPCHEDGECRRVNGLCMDRQCQCSFALNANGTCIVVGCQKNDDCLRNPGTTCVDSTCRCPSGSDLRNGRCWHRACKSHFQCSHERLHTVCFRSSCQCAHGFRDVDGTCMPIECSHNVECRDPLMRCRNASCGCTEGYVDNGERCVQIPRSQKKCLSNEDCKWSDLCLKRPCVCRRESFSFTGVCVESDRDSASFGRSATSSHRLFIAVAGIGIFLVTSAALVLFLVSFSKKESVELEESIAEPDGGCDPSVSDEWCSEHQHTDSTVDDPTDTCSVTPTGSQLSFQANVIVHTT
ncbi:hypothetical protein MTO96_005033 [Rhipicephalus appendiculatus]